MADPADSVPFWLAELHSTDLQTVEAAQEKLIAHYTAGLRALVCRRLHPKVAALESPTGVVNDAFNAIFTDGVRESIDRDSLWRLMAEIVICKTYNLNRHHFAQRRDVRRTEPLAKGGAMKGRTANCAEAENDIKRRYRKELKAPLPSQDSVPHDVSIVNTDTVQMLTMGAQPEHAAIVSESLKGLGELEELARLFIKGYGKHEIAKRLNLSPKTVTRKLDQIARILSEE